MPLHTLVATNDLVKVKNALKNKSRREKEINQVLGDRNSQFYGMTPAFVAASNGYLNIFRELCNRGADLKIKLPHGEFLNATAIYIAAHNGHKDVVDYCIEKKIPIDEAEEIEGILRTPLSIAAQSNYDGVVESLVQAGADANKVVKDIDGKSYSPLSLAAQNGHLATNKRKSPQIW